MSFGEVLREAWRWAFYIAVVVVAILFIGGALGVTIAFVRLMLGPS